MRRQAIVVGLGQFGMAVARALSEAQVEVIAVDNREERVRVAAGFAAEAIAMDGMNEDALLRTSPDRRDFALCAIGDESKDASIICTALLRQLGARRVIARANDALHARILRLVGAEQVVNPEREFGERFASRLLHDGIREEMSLGYGLWVTEVATPASFAGKRLAELRLPKRYGVTLVALRRAGSNEVVMPSASTNIHPGDILVLVAQEGAVELMMERC